MAFESMSDFFAMGGHGLYVWVTWGATALLLVVLAIHARLEHRQAKQALRRRVRREQHQAARATVSSDEGHVHES